MTKTGVAYLDLIRVHGQCLLFRILCSKENRLEQYIVLILNYSGNILPRGYVLCDACAGAIFLRLKCDSYIYSI